MALPTDANVELLICDAVRHNTSGKLDLAGYFPIPEIRLDPAVPLPATVDLTFVFVLKDGEGQFRATFLIIDPLGKELHRYDFPECRKPPGQAHIMVTAVRLIPITRSGSYSFVLELDGQQYRRPVRFFQ